MAVQVLLFEKTHLRREDGGHQWADQREGRLVRTASFMSILPTVTVERWPSRHAAAVWGVWLTAVLLLRWTLQGSTKEQQRLEQVVSAASEKAVPSSGTRCAWWSGTS